MVDNEVNYDRRRDILHPEAGCFFLALTGAAVGLDVRVMAPRMGALWVASVLLAGKVPSLFSSELEARLKERWRRRAREAQPALVALRARGKAKRRKGQPPEVDGNGGGRARSESVQSVMGTGEKARRGCSNLKRRRVFKERPEGGLVAKTRRPVAEGDRRSCCHLQS